MTKRIIVLKMKTLKKIKEEFAAGIGNTQKPANSKKSTDKEKKGRKSAIAPSKTSNPVDVAPPIGGGQ
jgi:hypothetical protein